MNKKTLKDLGYFQVIDILKQFTQSEPGLSYCENLLPYNDLSVAVKEGERVTQAKKLFREIDSISLDGICDIRPALKIAKIVESVIGIESIINVKRILTTAKRVKSLLERLDEDEYPYLVEYCLKLHSETGLIKLIDRTIGENSEILDTASKELYRIRREVKEKRAAMLNRLTRMIRDDDNASIIQEDVITKRNNRYVLLVKPNYNEHFKGIIHGDSKSGASYYVEPFEMIDSNNKMNLLITQEKDEERNILRGVTAEIRDVSENIIEILEALSQFDFLSAKMRLSFALNANEAELSRIGDGRIDLKNARHPLLYLDLADKREQNGKKEVIPIDIKYGESKRGLVISGANSGGKTAALKTLGLISLMAKAGMHVPADNGSSLIFFDKIFADIGDEQDLLKDKGTFSSHLINIKEIVDETDSDTLLLIDELGTGTNPTEGSAIFSALLDHLIDVRCYFIATTHLDKIKHYAYINPSVENVSVAFNEETLDPEYKLIYSQIGQSNALSLAEKIGLKDSIMKRAKEYISGDELDLNKLIKELELEKGRIVKDRERVAILKREADSIKEKHETMLKAFMDKKETLLKEKEREISDLFYETKKKLKSIVKNQKEEKAREMESFDEMTLLRKSVKKKFSLPKRKGRGGTKFKVNDNVFVESLKKDGVIIKIDGKKESALVNVGKMRVAIPIYDLSLSGKRDSDPGRVLNYVIEREGEVKHELNIIGKTVDEALLVVDKFLDEAYLSNLNEVTIIHGKGTGRLRTGVLKHLKEAPYVAGIIDTVDIIASAGATRVKIRQ